MTKEKQCAMDKRGTISIKLTPEELKMLKHFLNVLDSEEKGVPDTLPEQDDVMLSLTKDELNALFLILMEGEQCASVAFGSSFGTVSVDLGKKVQDAWKAHCWTKK